MRRSSPSNTVGFNINTDVSIPADCNTDLIHLATVAVEIGLYGLIKDRNSFETSMPLSETVSAAVREMYSFNAAKGQIKASSDDEKNISRDFPGLEVFKHSVKENLLNSQSLSYN